MTLVLHKNESTLNWIRSSLGLSNRGVDGRHFYVDPGSSVGDVDSDVEGDAVFSNLQNAIDSCADWRGDLITCKAGTQTVTTSVLFNKKGITVEAEGMGMPLETMGERFMIYGSATDEPAAVISQPCKILGMGFSSEYGSTGGHVLQIAGTGGWNGGFVDLYGCRFTHWGSTKHEQFVYINGPGNASFIRHCTFDGLFTGITNGAIELADHATGSDGWTLTIENNIFINTTYGIVHESAVAPSDCIYKSNLFLETKILDNNGCTNTNVLVADNWSPYATNATSYDDTVSTLQGLGIAFSDNHYNE